MRGMGPVCRPNWVCRPAPHTRTSKQGRSRASTACIACLGLALFAACSICGSSGPVHCMWHVAREAALGTHYIHMVYGASLEHVLHVVPVPDQICMLDLAYAASLWA